jgi:hypothetical protein
MALAKQPEQQAITERVIALGKTQYHIKSVFIGQTKLDDALNKIIMRRLEEKRRAA